jgi:hypothetical protein
MNQNQTEEKKKIIFEAFEKITEINVEAKCLVEILINRLDTDISKVVYKKLEILAKTKDLNKNETEIQKENEDQEQLIEKSINKSHGEINASDHMKSNEYKKYCALSDTRRDYLNVITNHGTKAEKEDAQKKRMEYLYEAKSLRDARIKLEYVILDVKNLELEHLIKQNEKLKRKQENEQKKENQLKRFQTN